MTTRNMPLPFFTPRRYAYFSKSLWPQPYIYPGPAFAFSGPASAFSGPAFAFSGPAFASSGPAFAFAEPASAEYPPKEYWSTPAGGLQYPLREYCSTPKGYSRTPRGCTAEARPRCRRSGSRNDKPPLPYKKMALKTKMQAPEAPKTGSRRAKSGVIAKYYTSRRIFSAFSLHNPKYSSTFAVYY